MFLWLTAKKPRSNLDRGFFAIQLSAGLLGPFGSTESLGLLGFGLVGDDLAVVAALLRAGLQVVDQSPGIDLIQVPKMQVLPTHLGRVLLGGDHLMLQDISDEVADALGVLNGVGLVVVDRRDQDFHQEPEHFLGDELVCTEVVFLGHCTSPVCRELNLSG